MLSKELILVLIVIVSIGCVELLIILSVCDRSIEKLLNVSNYLSGGKCHSKSFQKINIINIGHVSSYANSFFEKAQKKKK